MKRGNHIFAPPARLSALLAAVLLLVAAAAAWGAPFSFVALGDSQGNRDSEPVNAPVLAAMVAKVLEMDPRPAFVIFAGDLVLGRRPRDVGRAGLADQLRLWQQVVAPLGAAGVRVYSVPGNHEVGSAAQEAVRREVLGEPQYAFEHEGSRFIALDTEPAGQRATADLAWLTRELAAARQGRAEHVFVIGHEPAWPVTGRFSGLREAAQFWGLLARFGADAYICGHEHLYGRSKRSGVLQVITGGAGGRLIPLWGAEGYAALRGEHHLTVWRVDGPRVEVEALAWRPQARQWQRIDSLSYTKEGAGRPLRVKAKGRVVPAAAGARLPPSAR